ncbi:MAG: hypothetical protein OK455_03915 [Thaumarchaeota archaeon]|nr:hypothetical protein [Nitrososphaerota archaeon]
MRFLDIAVATAYAAICVSLIVVMNPVTPREGAVQAVGQARLDSAISAYVFSVGLPFFASSPEVSLCQSAVAASNATISFDVSVSGSSCPSIVPPSFPLAASSLRLELPGSAVVIQAWLTRR